MQPPNIPPKIETEPAGKAWDPREDISRIDSSHDDIQPNYGLEPRLNTSAIPKSRAQVLMEALGSFGVFYGARLLGYPSYTLIKKRK